MKEKILIVDDNARNIEFFRDSLLVPSGYAALCATDGEEALHLALTQKPDLILLDLQMPKLDGLSTLKKMLEIDPDANIIMCSALGQQQLIVQAIQLGAKDFIVKPFRPERVIGSIKKSLNIE